MHLGTFPYLRTLPNLLLAGFGGAGIAWLAYAQAPPAPPAPALSGTLPATVVVPVSVATPDQARPFFDYFSWESFIALNWPNIAGQNGVPNQPGNAALFQQTPNGAVLVWTTYKESFALFGQGANRPPAWNVNTLPVNPCQGGKAGSPLLVMAAKGGELITSPPNQAFSVPLIDQNNNYVYFDILFNQDQYNFTRGADGNPASWLYLVKNLAAKEPLTMPARSANYPAAGSTQGAIMLKTAWRRMTSKDAGCTTSTPGVSCRYYVTQAQVYDSTSKACSVIPMGLIGMHVVQKLKDFPEWIWSTFEQVDNVQPGPGAPAGTPISLNNGTNSPQTIGGWANRPSAAVPPLLPSSQRTPVQVTRYNPIPSSTAALNVTFQKALSGTVWSNYQLIFTQWPSQPQSFKTFENQGVYPKDSGAAFPANGVTNVTAETYFQSPGDAVGAGGNSCMSCHYRADQADFSWSLLRGAH
jgi:hypothetical protein